MALARTILGIIHLCNEAVQRAELFHDYQGTAYRAEFHKNWN